MLLLEMKINLPHHCYWLRVTEEAHKALGLYTHQSKIMSNFLLSCMDTLNVQLIKAATQLFLMTPVVALAEVML